MSSLINLPGLLQAPPPSASVSVEVCTEVFGSDSDWLPLYMRHVVQHIVFQYLDETTQKVIAASVQAGIALPCPVPEHVEFMRPSAEGPMINLTFLAPQFRTFREQCRATDILERIYHTGARFIGNGDSRWGKAFHMNSEILRYAMQRASDATVLEIGGASGENLIMMGYAGAKRAYMNDIDPCEMRTFRNSIVTLPGTLYDRLESIEGDCFTILDKKPDLEGQLDLILCQNVIHFFDNAQQIQFFKMIKKLLRVGGQAIFVTNAAYGYPRAKIEADPHASIFKATQCAIIDLEGDKIAIKYVYMGCSPYPDQSISFESMAEFSKYQAVCRRVDAIWQENKSVLSTLDKPTIAAIDKAIADPENAQLFNALNCPAIAVEEGLGIIYTAQTIRDLFSPDLFATRGLKVISTILIGGDGHRLPPSVDPWGRATRVAVIVEKFDLTQPQK